MVKNQEKIEIRQKMLARLAALVKDEAIRRSKDVENKLLKLSIYKEAKTIMFYHPVKGEVDLRGIIRKAFSEKKVCLPVTDLASGQLKIYQISGLGDNLAKGAFGIKEPNKATAKEIDISQIDTIIIPGLAFDFKKNRLGRGGGFYDRFLSKISGSAKKIGVAFDFQVIKSLPVNLFQDQKVDIVVTDTRVVN